MKLHFLVEGPSEQQLLEALLPRLIPNHLFQVYAHQGKGKLPGDFAKPPDPVRRGLLDQLPAILRAWRSMSATAERVVVLIDQDDDDCEELLGRFKKLRTHLGATPYFISRLAVEEVEAWYLGDSAAMRRAFGKVRRSILADYKQDSICGTWETFMEAVDAPVVDKVGWAARIGPELGVDEPLEKQNLSRSFRTFCRRVRELAGDATPAKTRPRKKPVGKTGAARSSGKRAPRSSGR